MKKHDGRSRVFFIEVELRKKGRLAETGVLLRGGKFDKREKEVVS